MHIAFVVSNLSYPPVEGLHQQSILTAQALAASGFTVTLFGFVKNLAALDEVALARDTGLRFGMPPIHTRLPDVLLGLANRLLPPALRGHNIRQLNKRLAKFDMVHLENVGAIGLVRPSYQRRTVLGLVDPGTLRWARFAATATNAKTRWSARFKVILHRLLQAQVLRPGTIAHLVSPADAEYLRTRYRGVKVTSIPVALPDAFVTEPPALASTERPMLLVFVDLRHSHLRQSFLWLAREVLPLSRQARTERLLVLGRAEPDRELRDAVAGMDVEFVTWVDDYRALLVQASVVVAPDLVGTGLKNRVLQSMATGRPVVGTSAAFEGIGAIPELHAVVTDNPAAMAAKLDALLTDCTLSSAMGAAGRAQVMARFSPDAVRREWGELYKHLAAQRS